MNEIQGPAQTELSLLWAFGEETIEFFYIIDESGDFLYVLSWNPEGNVAQVGYAAISEY